MKYKKYLKHITLTMVLVIPLASYADKAAIDRDAAIVELRKNCFANGVGIHNCFEDTISLTNWIEGTRTPIPNFSAPLKINIGPGTFENFRLNSISACHISIVGAGRQQTIITNQNPVAPAAFQFPSNCILSVSDLTIKNTGLVWAILVSPRPNNTSPGETTWTDVDVIGQLYGWQGGASCDSKHSWFNSRIIVKPAGSGPVARAYSTCAEDWFYSSEITVISNSDDISNGIVSSSKPFEMVALKAGDGAEVHVYGSIIRAITEQGVTSPDPELLSGNIVNGVIAITAFGSNNIHIHGSAIDVLSTEPNNIAVIAVSNNGNIHANETSYNLITADGGSITRILNNGGVVRAPATWAASQYLPNVISITGQDTAVFTGTADGHPHHISYDATCENKWFDTTSSECL